MRKWEESRVAIPPLELPGNKLLMLAEASVGVPTVTTLVLVLTEPAAEYVWLLLVESL